MSTSKSLKKKRPVNLALTTIRLPSTAIVSILHRISGILLFVLMPFALYALQQSLISPENFDSTRACFNLPEMRFFIWVFFSALTYHAIAGVRHLLMDLGWGETAVAGRKSACLVLFLAALLIIGWGVNLW